MRQHTLPISSSVHELNMDLKSQFRTYGFQFATGKLTVPSEQKQKVTLRIPCLIQCKSLLLEVYGSVWDPFQPSGSVGLVRCLACHLKRCQVGPRA